MKNYYFSCLSLNFPPIIFSFGDGSSHFWLTLCALLLMTFFLIVIVCVIGEANVGVDEALMRKGVIVTCQQRTCHLRWRPSSEQWGKSSDSSLQFTSLNAVVFQNSETLHLKFQHLMSVSVITDINSIKGISTFFIYFLFFLWHNTTQMCWASVAFVETGCLYNMSQTSWTNSRLYNWFSF